MAPWKATARLEQVLTYDPGTAIMRHVDAGYPEAIKFAKAHKVKVPTLRLRSGQMMK